MLSHGVGEFESGEFLLEHVLDVGGVGFLYVFGSDDTCDNGQVGKCLGCAGSCNYDGLQSERITVPHGSIGWFDGNGLGECQ